MCLEQRRPKTGFIVEMTAAIAFQRVTFNGTSLLGQPVFKGKFGILCESTGENVSQRS